jgi:hypothetical protein
MTTKSEVKTEPPVPSTCTCNHLQFRHKSVETGMGSAYVDNCMGACSFPGCKCHGFTKKP